jgi:hypothetical protein
MRIALPHNNTREGARKIVEQRIGQLLAQFGGMASDVEHEWSGDVLYFSAKARGLAAKGTVEVTDREVIIDGKLPLMALPFESKIRSLVQKEAESMFRSA